MFNKLHRIMTTQEMKEKFESLYNTMASSNNVHFMHIFGNVHKEMMEWFIANKPELANEWLGKLEAIKWKNYLTKKEAEKIADAMIPKAAWTYEQWSQKMEQQGFDTELQPCYNDCALFVTMNMEMSDSAETLKKYVEEENIFEAVRDFAVDKLTDKDGKFNVRSYFGV